MSTLEIQQKEERKNKIIGYASTAGIHALILLLLFWLMLTPPDPPIEYGGMELSMSLGEPDMGGPSPVPVEEVQPVTPSTPAVEEQIATQNIEEAPTVKTSEKPKEITKTPVKTPEKPVEAPRKVDERALFKKKTTTNGESGHGDGVIPGNEGNPDGTPNGSPDGNGTGDGQGGTGTGTGKGDGWGSFDLDGRSLKSPPKVIDESRETGKVIVKISVDRSGRVVEAVPGQRGSTGSGVLWEKAKQGALVAQFSARSDGPEIQYGTMTFIFKLKK